MNILKNRILTLFFIFLIFSPAPVFAAGFFANKDVIWQENQNEYFKYADQDKSSSGKNDHPVELEEKEVSAVLEAIKIQVENRSDKKENLKSIFTAQQMNMLSRYLTEGLKSANPQQDIIFAMEKSVKRSLGLKPERFFVAGRAFYKDNKLNIIIGDYDRRRDDSYEAAVDPTHVGIVRYQFDHGKRSKNSRFKETIVGVNGVEKKQLNNTQRTDWLVIDVTVASKAYDQQQTMRKNEEMAKKRKEIREILDSEEVIDHREETIPHKPTAPPSKVTSSSLEERLTTLKRLRDKNLITDEEYAQKRKQLLDEL